MILWDNVSSTLRMVPRWGARDNISGDSCSPKMTLHEWDVIHVYYACSLFLTPLQFNSPALAGVSARSWCFPVSEQEGLVR